MSMREQPFGAAATTSSTNDNGRQTQSVALRWCFRSDGSDRAEELLRSDDHLLAPHLVITEIANAAWKFVILDRVTKESAISAVREVAKAFEEFGANERVERPRTRDRHRAASSRP